MLFFIFVFHCRVSLVCLIGFSLLNDCCMIVVFSFMCFIVDSIVVWLLFFIAQCHWCVSIMFLVVVFHCRVSMGCSLVLHCWTIVVGLYVCCFFHSCVSSSFSLFYGYCFSLLSVIGVFRWSFPMLCFIVVFHWCVSFVFYGWTIVAWLLCFVLFFILVFHCCFHCCPIVVFHCCVTAVFQCSFWLLCFIVVFHLCISMGFHCWTIVVWFLFLIFVFRCFFHCCAIVFISVCHSCVSILFFIVVFHCRVPFVCLISFSLLNDCCMIVVLLLFFHSCVSLLFSLF